MVLSPEAILVLILSIFLFLVLSVTLTLVIVSKRSPTDPVLIVAASLVVLALLVVAVSPLKVPIVVGMVLAMLGTAVAALGGDPITRRILAFATHGNVRDGESGGILLRAPSPAADAVDAVDPAIGASSGDVREVMRGGTTIGYLERIAVVVAIIAGFPEALAVVVAVKGVGRFSELVAPESRERFIIGTMSSLLWACLVGALVRLSIW
ncbi:hypothetical protein [Microbacterium rhizomatis]|uniref:Uncharacterized protein n=1 Tax=Microbacterium rhizomatis TaxID=1631477 RepID=A0A5J5J832_9MICO|nr:hypothetical protein [Microbacterium rhizomatis]KAA9110978.1 hypothetical protein F6B43_04980 [Microbacterium rhizomatis]